MSSNFNAHSLRQHPASLRKLVTIDSSRNEVDPRRPVMNSTPPHKMYGATTINLGLYRIRKFTTCCVFSTVWQVYLVRFEWASRPCSYGDSTGLPARPGTASTKFHDCSSRNPIRTLGEAGQRDGVRARKCASRRHAPGPSQACEGADKQARDPCGREAAECAQLTRALQSPPLASNASAVLRWSSDI